MNPQNIGIKGSIKPDIIKTPFNKNVNKNVLSNKILSDIQLDIKDYIQYYKYRREIDNILIKISLTFYNELLTISNVKNNSSQVISDELQKFEIIPKLQNMNSLNNTFK